jgi:hypothetical protein
MKVIRGLRFFRHTLAVAVGRMPVVVLEPIAALA